MFLFDKDCLLRYHGRIDDALLDANVKRSYLREAMLDLIAGRKVRVARTMPLGCAIDAAAPSPLSAEKHWTWRASRSSSK